ARCRLGRRPRTRRDGGALVAVYGRAHQRHHHGDRTSTARHRDVRVRPAAEPPVEHPLHRHLGNETGAVRAEQWRYLMAGLIPLGEIEAAADVTTAANIAQPGSASQGAVDARIQGVAADIIASDPTIVDAAE